MISFDDVLRAAGAAARPTARIAYGDSPSAFSNLWLPNSHTARLPVIVFIHGGCWQSEYGVEHVAAAAESLAANGYAVYAPEYRRLGELGGGWPGTFDDVARAIDRLRVVADSHPIDLERVIVAGHSAGGQLAVWAAARSRDNSEALRLKAALSLAGILDLAVYGSVAGSCNASVIPLLGGTPHDVPERYKSVSPMERLPIGVPVSLVHGALDATVPLAMSEAFAERATTSGDDVSLAVVRDAGHFDVIAPGTPAWQTVLNELRTLLQNT